MLHLRLHLHGALRRRQGAVHHQKNSVSPGVPVQNRMIVPIDNGPEATHHLPQKYRGLRLAQLAEPFHVPENHRRDFPFVGPILFGSFFSVPGGLRPDGSGQMTSVGLPLLRQKATSMVAPPSPWASWPSHTAT